MSIWRGAQSAIFFYLSCAPCMDIRYKRARHRAALSNEAERAQTKTHHPDYPDQAPPGSINPFWQAEIDAGPRINKKEWKDAKERKSKELRRADSQRGFLTPSAGGGPSKTPSSSFLDAAPESRREQQQRQLSSHQRADESLWGASTPRADSHLASTSTLHLPSRPTTARTNLTASPRAYHADRHPAINDLHPPTTRKITSRDEVAWMLQPLPSAAVMQGKEGPGPLPPQTSSEGSRNRSGSDLSKPSPGGVKAPQPVLLEPIWDGKRKSGGVGAATPDSDGFGEEMEAGVEDDEDRDVLGDVKGATVPMEWVYEQTAREVEVRRSLDW